MIDPLGRHLAQASFESTVAGFAALLTWAAGFGTITLAGVEGTGAYGAGLTRFLTAEAITVVEVDRPDRKTRRDQGKSDPIDAYAAALTQFKALIVTAPDGLRASSAASTSALVTTCARLRPARDPSTRPVAVRQTRPRPGRLLDPTLATKKALASIAARVQLLDVEIADLDDDLHTILTPLAPTLLTINGVGLDGAGQLIVTAGDNPERITTEDSLRASVRRRPDPRLLRQDHRQTPAQPWR